MSRRRISQREARAAIKRVNELEARISHERSLFRSDYPGTHLGSIEWPTAQLVCEAIWTARNLGWAVVVKPRDNKRELSFYAVPSKVA
jgi:hypothetical protein